MEILDMKNCVAFDFVSRFIHFHGILLDSGNGCYSDSRGFQSKTFILYEFWTTTSSLKKRAIFVLWVQVGGDAELHRKKY